MNMKYSWRWNDSLLTSAIRVEGTTAFYVTLHPHDEIERTQTPHDLTVEADRIRLLNLMGKSGRNVPAFKSEFVQLCRTVGVSDTLPKGF